MAKDKIMTRKQYEDYFGLQMKFTKLVREYLQNHVLDKDDELDDRPISFAFVKRLNGKGYIQIRYSLQLEEYCEENNYGVNMVEVLLTDFERSMNLTE